MPAYLTRLVTSVQADFHVLEHKNIFTYSITIGYIIATTPCN